MPTGSFSSDVAAHTYNSQTTDLDPMMLENIEALTFDMENIRDFLGCSSGGSPCATTEVGYGGATLSVTFYLP